MITVSMIVPAAGSGTRMQQGIPKVLLPLNGKATLYWTLLRICQISTVKQILIPVHPSIRDTIQAVIDAVKLDSSRLDIEWTVVDGGSERMYSINNCIDKISLQTEVVAVHDAVRPFFDIKAFERCISQANEKGASILGLPLRDTIKKVSSTKVIETPNRVDYWSIQTPQCFQKKLFINAYSSAMKQSFFGTDDASVAEFAWYDVHVTEGNADNIKITYPIDLQLAELILKKND